MFALRSDFEGKPDASNEKFLEACVFHQNGISTEATQGVGGGAFSVKSVADDCSREQQAGAVISLNIDGKGVVNDAIHRPFFLYRLLLGLLPF